MSVNVCTQFVSSNVQSISVTWVQSVANSTHRQGLRSSTCPTFVVPRTRTKLGKRALSVSRPVAWNALTATIRNTTDSKLCKRLLKSHFYNRIFDITAISSIDSVIRYWTILSCILAYTKWLLFYCYCYCFTLLRLDQSGEWVTQSDPWPKWPIELLTHDPCDPWPMGHRGHNQSWTGHCAFDETKAPPSKKGKVAARAFRVNT